MFDMFGGFNASKLKPQLKMAISRFNIASNKKSALLKQNMRAVAVLLSEDPPKEELARIKAESLIRDDNMIEAYEILQLECELLSERIKLIEFSKECPPDLVSCVATLIYAAPRVEVSELAMVRKQFRAKYGKKFEEAALNNTGGILNERVVTKLSIQPPAANLVQAYLELICDQHEVDWTPRDKLTPEQMGEPMAPPVGYSVPMAQGTGLGHVLATTGQSGRQFNNHNDDKSNNGGGGGGGLPPIINAYPTPPPSSGMSHASSSLGHGSNQEQKDDFAEPDVYIPAMPSAPVGGGQCGSVFPSAPPGKPSASDMKPSKNDNKDRRDDDDDGGYNSTAGGSSSGGQTYQDLAARFESLQKL